MSGQRDYKPRRLAAVVASCGDAATRHTPLTSQDISSAGHANANLPDNRHLVW